MGKAINSVAISLTLGFVAINLSVGGMVAWLKLPVYLDSLGIVLATILLGWRYGALCAVLTVSIGFFVINPYLPFYILTSLAIVASVETLRRRNLYRNVGLTVLSGIIVGIVSAVVSAPVTALVFGGVTASGADLLTAIFAKTGRTLLESVFLAGFSSEPIDKTLVALVAFFALRGLPMRFLKSFDLRGYRDLRANVASSAT